MMLFYEYIHAYIYIYIYIQLKTLFDVFTNGYFKGLLPPSLFTARFDYTNIRSLDKIHNVYCL